MPTQTPELTILGAIDSIEIDGCMLTRAKLIEALGTRRVGKDARYGVDKTNGAVYLLNDKSEPKTIISADIVNQALGRPTLSERIQTEVQEEVQEEV